jgi:excisionase family DNA binding protein
MDASAIDELAKKEIAQRLAPIAVSIAQACQISGLSRPTLYRCIAAGKLPTRKLGARTLIMVDELRSFLSNLPQGGPR